MMLVILILMLIIKVLCKSMNNIEIKYVRKGEDIFLECPIQYPQGAKSIDVRWKRKEWKSTIYAYSQETLDREYIAPLYEDRLLRSNGATLKLLKVKTSDQDLFTCEVTFNFGKDISSSHKFSGIQQSSLFLVVNEKPVIIDISPRNIIVEPGTNISLFCKLLGQPLPTISWHKQNQILHTQKNTDTELNEISLGENESRKYVKIPTIRNLMSWYNMTNVNHGHSGDYKCMASNSEGIVEETIRLIIKGSIYFIEEPSDKIIQMGETVIIHCKATGDPSNITYHWFKNHKPIDMILNLEKRFQVLKSGSLRIIAVESYDGGEYMCIPSNGVQYKVPHATKKISNNTLRILHQLRADVYSTANITVYFKPIPHTIDQPIYLAINSNGFLPCSLTSNPVVKRIYWKKEGDNNGIYRYVSGLQYKKLKNSFTNNTIKTYFHEWDPVTKEDSGLYRCRGFNLMGNGEWSSVIQVIVKKSPYFLTKPASMYKVGSGENINIVCRAHGDPVPLIEWSFRNGTKIPDIWKNSKDKSIFSIEKATKLHENVYYCKAINPVKIIVARTTIIVASYGHYESLGPSNVTATCQLFSATVSWIIQVASGFFTVTDLLFKLSSNPNWEKRTVLSATITHQTLFGLIPDEQYQFCVAFKTHREQHFMSAIASCKTMGFRSDLVKHLPTDDHNNLIFPAVVKQLGPSPNPPTRLEVNVTSENKLSISWIPSGNISWPPILYYRVEYNHIPIDASQFYNSFKLSLQKYQTKWQQLKPVLHPQIHYVLPSSTIISSMSSLHGVLFRVRAYGLLSVSKPSHSVSIDRSLIEIILANEKEKIEIERSIASQNKWWPVIFWSLITLVFSSIIVLSILIVSRKCNFREFEMNNSSRKIQRSQKPITTPSTAHTYMLDSSNDSYILINNQNEQQIPAAIKNDQFQNCLGEYVKMSEVISNLYQSTHSPVEVRESILIKEPQNVIDSQGSFDVQNKFFHPLTRIKNDVNLYCNCHTYSPSVIVKNELVKSSKSHLMTEL